MKISFIHTQILVHLHVNETNFALGLALKQEAKGNSEIAYLRHAFARASRSAMAGEEGLFAVYFLGYATVKMS